MKKTGRSKYVIVHCKNCGKKFKKAPSPRKGRRLPNGVRTSNSTICSRECRKYTPKKKEADK